LNSNKDTETQNGAFGLGEIKDEKKNKINKKIVDFLKKFKDVKKDSEVLNYGNPYKREVKKIWEEFRSKIVKGAVTAVVAIAICVTVNHFGLNLGYEVYVDGKNIGLVTDKTTVFDAIENAEAHVKAYLGEDTVYEKEPVFVSRIVSENMIASEDEMKMALLSNVDALSHGYIVYVDDVPVFGVQSERTAKWVLDRYKENAIGEIKSDMAVDFCENIKVEESFMTVGMMKTPEAALDIISKNEIVITEYVVQESDTISDIAERFGTTVDRILAMNEGLEDGIGAGMTLQMETEEPFLSVRCTMDVAMTETVPFKIEKIEDDSLYEGRTVVEQEGKNGSNQVLASVTTVNGVEIAKKVITSEVLIEPVTQIEKVGTMERPPTTGSGTFENPTVGTLSSRYGQRWDRNHNGIDICGAHDSDIMAADGGLVVYADWMDGYGNYIIIDHENGYQTAYAHCNSLCVAVGDRVSKGEVIAKMGSTGRSTGTHLHFEVKKDGAFVNPLEYVGY